ncbi:MAG: acyl-CoA dehydrogenase family protein [Myxococcales bacterium]|nr:acyl-CoA dehydrogenase family protein [Myxococcales bacterium]
MDFRISPAEQDIQTRARRFAREHIAPHAAQWEREEHFPAETLRAYAQEGLVGLTVPKELGGPGASTVAYALSIMELAQACSATAVTVAVSSMVAEVLSRFATPEQHQRFLSPLLKGDFFAGSFALSEPGAGSDAASLRTSMQIDGDTGIINGEKTWISSGTHAGVFVVWVRDNGEGSRGISTVLVSPEDPGFSVGRKEDKMGLRASSTVSLHFGDCRIPVNERRLSQQGGGFRIAMTALDGGRIGVSSQAWGIAKAAMTALRRGLQEQRGSLIGEERAMIAQMETELQAAYGLILRAAWLKDHKKPFSSQAAMAKAYATETANRVCQQAVTLLGEEGCTQLYPIERLLRDCKVTTIYEGTSEVQRIVIARSLMRA